MLLLAQREQQPLAAAIIDLDHFKSVNDRHGHVAGDKLLAAFGALLIAHGRRSDIAFRFGGEEFCLLMPRTDAAAAQRKVEALLGAWRGEVFQFDTGTLRSNTFSAGVADSLAELAAMEPLLKAADDRLLEAKRGGRNQVLAVDAPAQPVEA